MTLFEIKYTILNTLKVFFFEFNKFIKTRIR